MPTELYGQIQAILTLAYHIFGEPDPAPGVDEKPDPYTLERPAGQVDAMPAARRLVYHALLYSMYAAPRCRIGSGQANAFTAVGEIREALIGNARALISPIWTGVAEAAVIHVPAMQASSGGQGAIPD